MKAPRDQNLFLAVFLSISFGIILTTWVFLPVYHREEEEETVETAVPSDRLLAPEELVKKAEKVLLQAESALSQLSSSKKEKTDKPPQKSKGPS